MARGIEKERRDVPEPTPVAMNGVRYEAVPWGKVRGLGQNGGYIGAFDEASGRELWLLKVYDVQYEGDMEQDKQDNFITEIAPAGPGLLRVVDERGRSFRVDVGKRLVV